MYQFLKHTYLRGHGAIEIGAGPLEISFGKWR